MALGFFGKYFMEHKVSNKYHLKVDPKVNKTRSDEIKSTFGKR